MKTGSLYKCEIVGTGVSSPWMKSAARATSWAKTEFKQNGKPVRIYRRCVELVGNIVSDAGIEAPR